jgi:uncharacterized protein (TIGR02646 family)
MFKIAKNEPKYFTVAKSKVKLSKIKSAWDDGHINSTRGKLRADILLDEQSLICAYCEKAIDDNPNCSNIDHFKTRNLFPEETLNYHNLLVSCNSHDRCSSFKDKNIKYRDDYENIINPVVENPDEYFDYLITGEIVAKNSKAEFTIYIFQLETNALIESRLQVYEALKYIDNLSLDEICEVFPDYHSFIKKIYPKLKKEGKKQ